MNDKFLHAICAICNLTSLSVSNLLKILIRNDCEYKLLIKYIYIKFQQETEVIPDRKLLQQTSSSSSSSSHKTDPYLDFFLALAICNTVVVSTATTQRERVSAPFTATVDEK